MTDLPREGNLATFALSRGASGLPFELRLERWEWVSWRLKILVAGQWVVLEEFQNRPRRLSEACYDLYKGLKRDDGAALRVEWDDGRVYVSYGDEASERRDLSHVAQRMSVVHDAVIDLDRFGADVFVLMGSEGLVGRVTRDREGTEHAFMVDGTSWREPAASESELVFGARDAVEALVQRALHWNPNQPRESVVYYDAAAKRWGRGTYLHTALNITQRGHSVQVPGGDRKGVWTYHVLPLESARMLGIPEAADIAA